MKSSLIFRPDATHSRNKTPCQRVIRVMQGRTAVAPCGHTGEVIIGSYVKCLVGCEGKPVVSMRGEPGHVANCSCKPCQIRRNTVTIVIRSKQGDNIASVPWDGTTNEVLFTPVKAGYAMHYRFLDKDGKIVAQGNLDAYLDAGYPVTVKVNMILDGANKMEIVRPFVGQMTFDPSKVIVTFNGKVLTGAIFHSGVFGNSTLTPTQVHDVICKIGDTVCPNTLTHMSGRTHRSGRCLTNKP